jgi:hydroxymethylbilane synthase
VDPEAEVAVAAERALLGALGGGCRTPVAGHARLVAGRLEVAGLVGHPSTGEIIRDRIEGDPAEAAALGRSLAERLLQRGAARILAELEQPDR